MPRFLAWLLVVVMLGGFAAVVGVVLRERAASGKGMPAYSIHSEGADGLGEAAHVLREAGYRPEALTRALPPAGYRGLLVVAGPEPEGVLDPRGLGEPASRALLQWVEAGNALLLASRTGTALHELLGVTVTDGPPGSADLFTTADLEADSPYLEDVERLSVRGEATLAEPAGTGETLWELKGRPAALALPRGEGTVIVVADPGLLTRHGLVRADGEPRDDNVVFLANVVRLHAAGGRVLFDEYHHGFRAGTGFWGYLAYHGRRWTVLPFLVVVLVPAWRAAVRLGPAVPRPAPARADAVDYASALARLYQRAGARRLLARVLVRDFVAALTAHLRLRRAALPALILSAWREHDKGPSADRLGELMRGVVELRKGEAGERQLLRWARAFGDFRRAHLRGPG